MYKQHYWLRMDVEVQGDTLEQALLNFGKLFRKQYRAKLREGAQYMGAYATKVNRLTGVPKAPRTVVQGKKITNIPREALPTCAEVVAQDKERAEKAKEKKTRKPKESATDSLLAGLMSGD